MPEQFGAHAQNGGVTIRSVSASDVEAVCKQLEALQINQYVMHYAVAPDALALRMHPELVRVCAPGYDTLQLCEHMHLHPTDNTQDLEREILLSMLLSPVDFEFPSLPEYLSALRIRKNIVLNARQSQLAFSTDAAERPEGYWAYQEDTGFTLVPGKSLIEALQKATQPGASGKVYSFSCYRATEYVILLSIAQELIQCNPTLYLKLQAQWEKKAIMSGKFHEVFLHEYGSMEQPLPTRFYVPGDRLWFRNPDEHSSDAAGYEGSWVFYLGNGQFTNFWKREQPYTLTSKCVEIYHWRHATWKDASGELQIDEDKVESLVRATMQDAGEVARILEVMLRLREPKGVYRDGGCIDTSREYPRLTCPGTCDMGLA